MFESIKNDQGNHYDTIVDHGYTGKIDQEYIKEISGSILISVITCSKTASISKSTHERNGTLLSFLDH